MPPERRHRRRIRRTYLTVGLALLICAAIAAIAYGDVSVTESPGSPIGVGAKPRSVAYSANGSWLALANETDHTVSIFSVGSSGALTQATGSPGADDYDPVSIALSPDGTRLATANQQGNSLSVFTIASDGELSYQEIGGVNGPFDYASASGPSSVAFSPTGPFLAVSLSSAHQVAMYQLEPDDKYEVVGTPTDTQAGLPAAVAFSPNGNLLAVADGDPAGHVTMFQVGGDGSLSPVTGSPFATGGPATAVAFSPDGGLLVTANSTGNNASVFTVNSGTLTPAAGSPVAVGTDPEGVAFASNGSVLAIANEGSNNVSLFSYSSSGALTPTSGSPLAVGNAPASVAFKPGGGQFAVVDSADNALHLYSYAAVTPPASTTTTAPPPTTSTPSGTGTTPSTTTTTPAPVGLVTTISSLKTAGSAMTLGITCTGPAGKICTGTAAVTAHVRKQGGKVLAVSAWDTLSAKKPTTVETKLAAGKFKLTTGAKKTVRISLNATGRKLLDEFYRLKATVTFSHTTSKPQTATFAYTPIISPVTYTWHSNASYTYETQLDLSGLPKGATITLSCHGGGCPRASRPVTTKTSRYSLTKALAHVHLRPGAQLTLTIAAPNSVAKVVTFVIHGSSRTPTLVHRCAPPGVRTPVKCHA